MAERAKPGRKRASSKKAPAPSASSLAKAMERLEAKIEELRTERDRLDADLTEAQNRINSLEQANIDAVNRIDWVIDSLQNLVEEEK